jgi:hypothetical protein
VASPARRIRPATPRPADDAVAIPQALRIVGTVVAPTTLLTVLMLYFGRLHATGLFDYFGVQQTVLDLTPQDFLVRSADGLIIPLVVVAIVAVIALWLHQVLTQLLSIAVRRAVLRVLIPVAAVAGVGLVGVALVDAFGSGLFDGFGEARGLALAVGAVLLAYAARLVRLFAAERRGRRPRRVPIGVLVAEWAAMLVLVSVGLFWAVGTYAAEVGAGRGAQLEALLPDLPEVAVYSKENLHLVAPGVVQHTCEGEGEGEGEAYGFRYDGLRMVMQSGSQYLLLPAAWTRDAGAAILLARNDSIRLEFSVGTGWRADRC